MAQPPKWNDNTHLLVYKILEALVGPETGSGSGGISGALGSGSAVTTGNTATIAVTGTAVLAIASGARGYILAASTNAGSIFVGGSDVTNAGAKRGLELAQLGMSPVLTGPVYINGTAADVAGVVLV